MCRTTTELRAPLHRGVCDYIAGMTDRFFNREYDRLISGLRISRAALYPGAPITPPPGCAPDPHRYRPRTGVRYRAQPATGRRKNI